MLAGGWVDAPEPALRDSLAAEGVHRFARFAATFPWRSHAAWIVTQMLRWGQIEKPLDVRAAAALVYRSDLYREAAAELGVPCPAQDEKAEGIHDVRWSVPREGGGTLELGPDLFIDGRRFDPRDPGGYLAGYLLAGVALGYAARRGWDRSVAGMAAAMLVGNLLIYVPGLAWLHHLVAAGLFDPAKYASPWQQTLAWGLTPYLVGDALKLALAALVVPALWRLVGPARV